MSLRCRWAQVDAEGQPILPLDGSLGRFPTEPLLLCRATGGKPAAVQEPAPRAVLVAAQQQHSRKPRLARALACCLAPAEGGSASEAPPLRQLELFARELEEGWASWGNEPLRFQQQ